MAWDANNVFPNDSNTAIGRQEFVGSPTYQFGTQIRSKREMYCPWGDFQNFLRTWWVDPDNTLGYGTGPRAHPTFSNLWVTAVQITPFAGTNSSLHPPTALSSADDINVYDQARITLDYESFPDWSLLGGIGSGKPTPTSGTLLNYQRSASSELLCVPGRHWIWSSDSAPLPPDINPGVKIVRQNLVMRQYYVINPNYTQFNAAMGCVNSATFMDYTAGCVLFHSWSEEYVPVPYATVGGYFNITFQFLTRQAPGTATASTTKYGWNHFYRRDVAAGAENWNTIVAAKNGANPYPSYNFSTLF